ncbi:beta-defensin 108B [Castor canadensis]|uniref:Beta-defensin 108B n=1 Tax=Castor canadensis TaxID=51338 RepID=A0AC58KX01_CASCN
MKIFVLLFNILYFVNQLLPVRGKIKEICERPNGSCQKYCIKTEVYVGRCLDLRPCCLPMGNQPRIESTTPKKS